jgi:pyruvate dehydrogenase phosphatase
MLGLLHMLLSVCDGVWSTSSALGAVTSSGDNSKGCDNLLWWHDLARCHAGNVSIIVA